MREAFTDRTWDLVAEIEALSSEVEDATGQRGITIEDWCQAFCGATVEGSTLHGDSATVRIRVEDDVEEIPVVRQPDGWRIDLSGQLEPAVEMLRLAVGQASGGEASEPATGDTAGAGAGEADTLP